MNKKDLMDLIKASNLDKINTIYDDNKSFEINIKGTRKEMVVAKKEKLFSEAQLKQIAEVVVAIINETVPPIVVKIINETVPNIVRKIIAEEVNPRLDRIEQRLDRIEKCPTIAKELKELENNK